MISARALELIKSFEKCRLGAYKGAADAPGVYTIGWGHVLTGHEVPDLFKPHQMMKDVSITQQRADELFEEDIDRFTRGVIMRLAPGIRAQLSDDQLGAIVSFSYNIGLGGFAKSLVLVHINDGQFLSAGEFFRSYVKSNGVVQSGLIRRRAAERALWLRDDAMFEYFMNNSNSVAISKARKYIGRL